MSSQCQGRTVKGSQCTRRPQNSGGYCWQHIDSQRLIPVHNNRLTESPSLPQWREQRSPPITQSIGSDTSSEANRPRPKLVVRRPTRGPFPRTECGVIPSGLPAARSGPRSQTVTIDVLQPSCAQSRDRVIRSTGSSLAPPVTLQRKQGTVPTKLRTSEMVPRGSDLKSVKTLTRQAYLRMSVQDRLQIPMSSVIRTLKIYILKHSDSIIALTPRDQLISARRLRSRLDAFFHRPEGPYLDLTGNKYYNENHPTLHGGRPLHYLHYGESYCHPYNRSCRILGEGDLNLERQSYDPIFQTGICEKLEVQISDAKEYINHKERVLDSYKMDLVTFCELSELDDPDMIYLDASGRAYYLHSILGRWEAGFSIYDKECGRVVPQYPLDFNNEPMHPQLVRNIYGTYQDRVKNAEARTASSLGIETPWGPKEYPLIGVLCRYGNLLEDVYGFIVGYTEIRRKYDSLTQLYPEDEGLANRRDLMAIQALKAVYERQKLENFGYRKYASYTSTNGANGTQVFYQYVLCSLFMAAGYRPAIDTQDDDGLPVNLRWEYLPGEVSAIIVGSSMLPICRHGYHYLLAFK